MLHGPPRCPPDGALGPDAGDSTDDEVHGRQEGRFYHGYYNHYCFLPLYITCGGRPLFALLRPGNADPARGVRGPLGRIVERLRQRWPGLEILLRADSAYAREEILAWCEDNGVDYVIGLARNSRLVEKIGWELADAQAEAERRGRPARRFSEFLTPPSQAGPASAGSSARPSTCPASPTPASSSPRCPTPSRPGPCMSASTARGATWRTRSKEQQLDLFSDRTSASRFAANQLRILFSAFASILFDALRRALHGTRLARATAGTLRLKLLKIGARVTVSMRRVKVAMDSAHPSAAAFARVHARLARVTTPHTPETPFAADPPGITAPHDQKRLAHAAALATPAPSHTVCGAACSCSPWFLGRNSAQTLPQPPSAVTV